MRWRVSVVLQRDGFDFQSGCAVMGLPIAIIKSDLKPDTNLRLYIQEVNVSSLSLWKEQRKQ